MSNTAASGAPSTNDGTARVVRGGSLLALSESPVDRYHVHYINLLARSLAPFSSPVTALDLACGNGTSTLTLLGCLPRGSRVVALSENRSDLRVFHEQLSKAMRRVIFPRKEKRDRLPFAQQVFDVAWASLAFEWFHPVRPVLRAALRVLKPGGRLLLSAPLRPSFNEWTQVVGPRLNGYEKDPAFSSLVSEPSPSLLDLDEWKAALERCGGLDVKIQNAPIEIGLAPPLSQHLLFTRCVLPLWTGRDPARASLALQLLDKTVKAPLRLTMHVGCATATRGQINVEEPSVV